MLHMMMIIYDDYDGDESQLLVADEEPVAR